MFIVLCIIAHTPQLHPSPRACIIRPVPLCQLKAFLRLVWYGFPDRPLLTCIYVSHIGIALSACSHECRGNSLHTDVEQGMRCTWQCIMLPLVLNFIRSKPSR